MPTNRKVVDFKIHNLTEEQFQELKAQGKIDPNAVYCTPDESLKTDQITNCITEIPQDIKIQTSGETVTLKAGSKVYIPNGNGVFNEMVISADISNTGGAIDAFVVTNGRNLNWANSAFSGATAPSAPTTGTLWYDTANNLVKRFSSDGSWVSGYSFPVALFNSQDNSKTKIFNGFGYIGSTVFALPGVKGLVPSGRNKDGTLKNTEFTTGSVLTQTLTGETFDARPVILRANILGFNANASYDDKANTLSTGGYMIVGTGSAVSGKITSFKTKTAFHAVDYSDFETLSDTVETNNDNAVHKTGDETISGIKTFSSTIGTGAGAGITIAGTDYSYTMRSSGATPNGCGLFLDNSADGAAFNATNTKITVGSNNIVPCAITPPSSDNSTRIATTAWVNTATVHKTGDETIGGTKNFAAPTLTISNVAGTGGTGLNIRDSNGKGQTYLQHFYTGGRYYSRLMNRNATAAKTSYVEVVLNDDGKSEFTSYNVDNMYAPTPVASSNSTNIATTAFVKSVLSSSGNGLATFSKATNGYYKFNNGLIIQWGRAGQSTNERAVNFPTPFSNTNYAIVANPTTSNTTESFYSIATDESQKNTSSCVLRCSGHINTVAWLWIAIGY